VEKLCYFCSKQSRFSEVKNVSFCGSHLIFQLLRFPEENGTFVNNSDHVLCDNVIMFPIHFVKRVQIIYGCIRLSRYPIMIFARIL